MPQILFFMVVPSKFAFIFSLMSKIVLQIYVPNLRASSQYIFDISRCSNVNKENFDIEKLMKNQVIQHIYHTQNSTFSSTT